MNNIVLPILRTTVPPSRYNDDLDMSDKQRQTLIKHLDTFKYKNFKDCGIEGTATGFNNEFFMPWLHTSLVYIITETVGDYPYPYFSEKTWRAMITGVPFMLVGAPGSLNLLRSFGFKTFGSWWDENYDNLPTVADRIDGVVNELKKLNKMDLKNLSRIKEEMLPTLKHNRYHMREFRKNNLENIKNSL